MRVIPLLILLAACTGESERTLEGAAPQAPDTLIVLPTPGPAAPAVDPLPPPTAPTPAGRLLIPVAGVAADDLQDTFTDARSENRVHDAIDIMAPRGTPVLAAADGRILRLFLSEKGGKTIYQQGRDGLILYYAHLDGYAPTLTEGAFVRRGDILGYVGDTGNAVPGNTHLHFALWTVEDTLQFWDGPPVNPYPMLKGAP